MFTPYTDSVAVAYDSVVESVTQYSIECPNLYNSLNTKNIENWNPQLRNDLLALEIYTTILQNVMINGEKESALKLLQIADLYLSRINKNQNEVEKLDRKEGAEVSTYIEYSKIFIDECKTFINDGTFDKYIAEMDETNANYFELPYYASPDESGGVNIPFELAPNTFDNNALDTSLLNKIKEIHEFNMLLWNCMEQSDVKTYQELIKKVPEYEQFLVNIQYDKQITELPYSSEQKIGAVIDSGILFLIRCQDFEKKGGLKAYLKKSE